MSTDRAQRMMPHERQTHADLHPTHTDTGGVEMYESDDAIGTDAAVVYYQGVVGKLNHEGDFSGVQHMKKTAPQTEHDWSHLHRPNQWQPLIITDTSVVEQSVDLIGFNARSVVVHNLSPQHLYLPDARAWVPPGVWNAVLRLPYAVEQGRVMFLPPPGVTQPNANAGAQVVTLWTEELLEPAVGSVIPAFTAPAAVAVLDGGTTLTGAGNSSIITVPAGRTWVGFVGTSIAGQNPPVTATGAASATIQTVGAGATPAAGTVYAAADIELAATVAGALSGEQANAAVTGQRLVVVAPAGNSVTVSLFVLQTGTVTGLIARGWADGELQ